MIERFDLLRLLALALEPRTYSTSFYCEDLLSFYPSTFYTLPFLNGLDLGLRSLRWDGLVCCGLASTLAFDFSWWSNSRDAFGDVFALFAHYDTLLVLLSWHFLCEILEELALIGLNADLSVVIPFNELSFICDGASNGRFYEKVMFSCSSICNLKFWNLNLINIMCLQSLHIFVKDSILIGVLEIQNPIRFIRAVSKVYLPIYPHPSLSTTPNFAHTLPTF